MSTPNGYANGVASPWSGTSTEPQSSNSAKFNDDLRLYWYHLKLLDKHLSALDSLSCSRAGEIESIASTAILTASSERP